MPNYILHIIFIGLLFMACVNKPEEMTGPTMGSLEIIADESMKYVVEQEENIFERTYPYAKLNIRYMPENDVIRSFMQDTFQVIMTTRQLTEEEVKYFEQRQAHPRQYAFATGALAFIVNKNVKDTTFTYETLITLFRDKEGGKLFVIENAKSGITGEILRLINSDTLPSHFYALNSKKEVIDYVMTHDNAIGIVDLNDLSDSDAQFAKEILASIELVGISRPVDSIQHGFVRPYQYNLQDRKYPFTRDLYIISRTGKSDVGTGFASFITGEIGQKIVLKSGLLPKYQSERVLEIRNSSDIKVIK
jgi:phosphate transport system substrate-binding protein